MADISNLILSSAPTTGSPAETAATEPSATENIDQSSGFAMLFANKMADRQVAQSGKQLPQSGDGLETETQGQELSELHSHQLKGGLQLIVAGEAPSAEGISAFAKSQGIDPTALNLLLGDSAGTDGKTVTAGKGLAANEVIQPSHRALPDNSLLLDGQMPVPLVEGKTYQAAGGDMLAAWIASSGAANNSQAWGTVQQPLDLLAQQKQMASQGLKPVLTDTEKLVTAKLQPQGATTDAAIAQSAKQLAEALKQAGVENLKKKTMTQSHSQPVIKAEMTKADVTMTGLMPEIAGKLLFKAQETKSQAENLLGLNRSAQSAPAVKLEVINLAVPAVSAAPVSFGESAFLASQHSSAEMLNKPVPEDAMQQALRKQDEHMEMSRRLTEALGQRLTAQITRGAWRVEMDLHPKSLGRIEIQLEMKNGEIEANFHAANSATRELLAESMPRLRSALEEHGMETAYIELELANQGKSDGNSTARQQPEEVAENAAATEPELTEINGQPSADGLDVLV
jgi:flagellar hook-length control protein FliK